MLLVFTVIASVIRVTAYGSGDPEQIQKFGPATELIDLALTVIVGLFTIVMMCIGIWFLLFLKKQEQTSIQAATVKVNCVAFFCCAAFFLSIPNTI